MKLDDLLRNDAIDDEDDGPLDVGMVNALAAFGFVSVGYTLRRAILVYVGTISGHRADGSIQVWQGIAGTPEEAEKEAIDQLVRWIGNQKVGGTP